jgi:hypothetical protein
MPSPPVWRSGGVPKAAKTVKMGVQSMSDHCAKGSKKLAQWPLLAQWSDGYLKALRLKKKYANPAQQSRTTCLGLTTGDEAVPDSWFREKPKIGTYELMRQAEGIEESPHFR